jgi:hypothetical protein
MMKYNPRDVKKKRKGRGRKVGEITRSDVKEEKRKMAR